MSVLNEKLLYHPKGLAPHSFLRTAGVTQDAGPPAAVSLADGPNSSGAGGIRGGGGSVALGLVLVSAGGGRCCLGHDLIGRDGGLRCGGLFG